MKHGLTHIDHPVIGVRDMEAARAVFERLGFIVPPRGSHPAWGTGNWCIQFAHDYLELRGVIDAARAAREAHGLTGFLAEREGLMGVAFGTTGAQGSHDSLAAAGLHPRPVKPLTRNFELPEGTMPVSFALCFLDPAEVPGLMLVVVCEHLTPERLRRPEWLRHPNGVKRIRGLTGVVGDLAVAATAHTRMFDEVKRTAHEVRITLADGGRISLVTPDALMERFGGGEFAPPLVAPALAAVTLEVANVAETAACLRRNGVPLTESAAGLVISPTEACGVRIEFVGLAACRTSTLEM